MSVATKAKSFLSVLFRTSREPKIEKAHHEIFRHISKITIDDKTGGRRLSCLRRMEITEREIAAHYPGRPAAKLMRDLLRDIKGTNDGTSPVLI
jgi:hypothetical protein